MSGQPDTPVGGGNRTDIVFQSDTTEHVTFPLAITYSSDIDPSLFVITDIVNRCGLLTGASPGDLPIKYTLTVRARTHKSAADPPSAVEDQDPGSDDLAVVQRECELPVSGGPAQAGRGQLHPRTFERWGRELTRDMDIAFTHI